MTAFNFKEYYESDRSLLSHNLSKTNMGSGEDLMI